MSLVFCFMICVESFKYDFRVIHQLVVAGDDDVDGDVG